MCNVCGCGGSETLINGRPLARAHGRHQHVHADGTAHDHEHGGAHTHAHGPGSRMRYRRHDNGRPLPQVEAAVSMNGDLATLHYGRGPAGAHAPGLSQARMVQIEQDVLAKNDGYARANRTWLINHGIFALNLVSSPGSGKTTLLVKTIELLRGEIPLAVIEGDQQTDNDAARIRATGAPALQINTGKGCHLDACMVGRAMEQLQLADDSLLLIENVGNLVCPASFDLGEAHKVAILSVTEGEDKPLKYPDMFRAADLMLLNKCDLLPYLGFDVELAAANARRVNPDIEIIRISATSGEGMETWLEWIRAGCRHAVANKAE